MNTTKYIELNNGVKMPQIGLGTFLIPSEKIPETIKYAYELGYRNFDTAWRYRNESIIYESLKNNNISRKDVFLTTKINADALYYWGYFYGKHKVFNIRNFKSIENVIKESFNNLNTNYIDLFLVHWPWPMYGKMYEKLCDFYERGEIRAIGVSSFTINHIKSLKDVSDIVPAVNQIEISPLNTQKNLIAYCQENNIAVQAMSTFSHFRSNEPRKEILDNKILKDIARKYEKSVVQIVLRWLLQQDIIIIPKTWDKNHLKENIEILDFELSNLEMQKIDSLDRGVCLNYNPYLPHIIKDIPKKFRE